MARKRDYASEYARRKARARSEGYRSFWAKRAAAERQPAPSYTDLTEKEKTIWHKSFQVLTRMEKGASLSHAAREEHTTPAIVRKYMGEWLQPRDRRWVLSGEYLKGRALKLRVLTEEGYRSVLIADPATRSEYARYSSYIGMYFSDNPEIRQRGIEGLSEFEGGTFTDASGQKHPYITDRKLLIELEGAGQADLEGLYDEMAK